MQLKNRYIYRARISETKFRALVRYFALDLEACKIAALTGLSVNTVNRYLLLIRQRIARLYPPPEEPRGNEHHPSDDQGPAAIDGRLAQHPPAIGIRAVGGRIHTRVLSPSGPAPRRDPLPPDGTVEAIVTPGARRLRHVPRDHDPTDRNGPQEVDRFWSFARSRLMKFFGLPRATFYLHLKECEFRFNHRREDLYGLLLKMLRDEPLNL